MTVCSPPRTAAATRTTRCPRAGSRITRWSAPSTTAASTSRPGTPTARRRCARSASSRCASTARTCWSTSRTTGRSWRPRWRRPEPARTESMSDDATLLIEDLHVNVDDKEILHGLNLKVEPGKVHALMGPNGSGKSTLAYALAGHPRYKITGGSATFKGDDVLSLTPDERARLGMFLAMQYPVEVPGVSVTNFLRTAINAVRGEDVPVRQFAKDLREQMKLLEMDPKFAERSLNEGF